MERAKSRIETRAKKTKSTLVVKSAEQTAPVSKKKHYFKSLFLKYLKHLPTFIFALLFSGTTYLILTRIHPENIKHFLIPNSYLPLLISVFLSSFFLFSFILLNSRRGFLISLLMLIFLFLHLQQTEIPLKIVFFIVAPLFFIETIISLIKAKF